MEALLAAAFGRKIEIQKGQSDQITDAAAVIFETANEKKLSSVIALVMLLSKRGVEQNLQNHLCQYRSF